MTIANSGSGPGDVTVLTSDSTNADFEDVFNTVPQVLAVSVPEPAMGLFVMVGVLGLAVTRRKGPAGSKTAS